MNINLGQIEKKLKNVYILGSKPIQDWQRIIIIFLAVLLGVLIWSYFFYFTVQSEFKSNLNMNSQITPVKDKEAEIREVVEKYKARVIEFGSDVSIDATDLNNNISSTNTSSTTASSSNIIIEKINSSPKATTTVNIKSIIKNNVKANTTGSSSSSRPVFTDQ